MQESEIQQGDKDYFFSNYLKLAKGIQQESKIEGESKQITIQELPKERAILVKAE